VALLGVYQDMFGNAQQQIDEHQTAAEQRIQAAQDQATQNQQALAAAQDTIAQYKAELTALPAKHPDTLAWVEQLSEAVIRH